MKKLLLLLTWFYCGHLAHTNDYYSGVINTRHTGIILYNEIKAELQSQLGEGEIIVNCITRLEE